MKTRLFTLSTALLILTAPLMAQDPDNYNPEQETVTHEATIESPDGEEKLTATNTVQETEDGIEASASLQATDQEPTEAEADLEAEMDYESDELPRTASPLALLALLGMAGAGSAMTARRRRNS